MKRESTSDTLIKNLNHLMVLYGYTADDVAKKSGITKRAILYYLNKERVPNIEKAELLASAFGLRGWHLIMPNLPKDISETSHLNTLVKNYISANSEGKKMIHMISEREASYNDRNNQNL